MSQFMDYAPRDLYDNAINPMSESPADSDLLLRIRKRDRESVETLYDRHAPRLNAVALQILGDKAAASAAIEELFLALWDGSEEYDRHYGSPASWLVRVLRDRALAKQAQKPAAAVGNMKDPPTPRRIVEQAFFGGMTVASLANAYSLPETEVRQLLASGIAELKEQFAGGVK